MERDKTDMDKTRRVRGAIATAGFATVAYAACVAPRRVQVTQHVVRLTGLPSMLHGLRVVQVSDLHLSWFFRPSDVRRAVASINAWNPDVVVMTGDYASFRSLRFVAAGACALRHLRASQGVFACLGNHDHWEGPEAIVRNLEQNDIRVLVNESRCLAGGLWLAAVDDLMCGQPDLARALEGVPEATTPLVLSHNPLLLLEAAPRSCVILAGHTHGGQVALPFLGPRRMPCLPGWRAAIRMYEALGVCMRGGRVEAVATHRYPAGWYRHGSARLYVNRGLGVGQDFPFRLNCPPEIACFTLAPS